MVEKKQLVFDLLLKYNGPLSVEEFYGEVEKWMTERGLHRDLKRKSEDVTSRGKKIEWIVECWRNPARAYKQVTRLRVLFNNVKEAKITRNNRTVKINKGDILIVIDGFLETSLTSRWTQKPLYAFFRTLYDKYIWMTMDRYEAAVNADCYELHKRLKAFFELYKSKVQ